MNVSTKLNASKPVQRGWMLFCLTLSVMVLSAASVHAEEFFIPPGDVTSLIDAIIAANQDPDLDTIILGADLISGPGDPPIAAGAPQPDQLPRPGITRGSVYTLSKNTDDRIPLIRGQDFTGLPRIRNSHIVIQGNGAIIQRDLSLNCTSNGDANEEEFRIFEIYGDGNLTLEDLTIKNGCADGTAGAGSSGGGILIVQDGELTLNFVSIVDNVAKSSGAGIQIRTGTLEINHSSITDNLTHGSGGGIAAKTSSGSPSIIIRHTTISGNSAGYSGGGIINQNGFFQLINSTVTNNIADNQGDGMGVAGGIFNGSSINDSFRIRNTIIAGNAFPTDSPDCVGSLTSLGYNLIGIDSADCEIIDLQPTDIIGQDPRLGPLENNGGSTLTHALLPDSPAINRGDCPPGGTDQRGKQRVVGPACDIGSFESNIVEQEPPPVEPPAPNQAPTVSLSIVTQDPTEEDTILFAANASDPDGDSLTYEWSINGVAQPQIQGSTAEWDNPAAGTHTVRVRVSDGNGGSDEAEVTFTVSASTPEPQPLSLAQALDTNSNGRLDDDEILSAIQFWISGELVPGAEQSIDDVEIIKLIGMWILGSRP